MAIIGNIGCATDDLMHQDVNRYSGSFSRIYTGFRIIVAVSCSKLPQCAHWIDHEFGTLGKRYEWRHRHVDHKKSEYLVKRWLKTMMEFFLFLVQMALVVVTKNCLTDAVKCNAVKIWQKDHHHNASVTVLSDTPLTDDVIHASSLTKVSFLFTGPTVES